MTFELNLFTIRFNLKIMRNVYCKSLLFKTNIDRYITMSAIIFVFLILISVNQNLIYDDSSILLTLTMSKKELGLD